MKEPYINNLIKMVNDNDLRDSSLNKDYNLRNSVQSRKHIIPLVKEKRSLRIELRYL